MALVRVPNPMIHVRAYKYRSSLVCQIVPKVDMVGKKKLLSDVETPRGRGGKGMPFFRRSNAVNEHS
jgi:hypothetical protein